MRVGLVIYGSPDTMSGGYLYDRKLTAYLRSQGDQVELISLPPATYAAHLFNNLTFRLPPSLDILIEDELVHPSALLANWVHRAGRADAHYPLISLIHNLHSSERRASWKNAAYAAVEKWHLRSVDGHIFNSATTRDSADRLVGIGKAFVIAPPGGDRLGTLTLEEVRRRASQAGPLRLLFLANITPLKGLHVLLDALERLPALAWVLDVAGSLSADPSYAGTMQARAARLSGVVTFHGIVDNQPLIDLLSRTDLLVLPSFWEGFGIAFLEGMSFGVPAIGTTAGAIPEVITHGSDGFLIQPGDSAALAAFIERLMSDRPLLARMSENALKRFASFPTWDQSSHMIRDFLLKMIERR